MMRCLYALGLASLVSVTAFSQDLDELIRQDRIERERRLQLFESSNDRVVRRVREAFVEDQLDMAAAELDARRFDLVAADRNFVAQVPQFRKALEQYREAVAVDKSSTKPLKELDRYVHSFNAYFKQTHTDAPEADPSEFIGLTKTDLLRETLTTAERVDSKLPQAVTLVQKASVSNIVTVQTMSFLRMLHGELRRLDFLISKLK